MNHEAGPGRIRVLVVDDSLVWRELIVQLLESDPRLQVVGVAHNGEDAIGAVRRLRPDVVTMDYHMPTLNGMEATRRIMEEHPVPIVIVSGSSAPGEAVAAFRLLEAGAVAVVEKPPGLGHPAQPAAASHLLQTVKLMAEVKVVRRWPSRKPPVPAGATSQTAWAATPRRPAPMAAPNRAVPGARGVRGIVIGASTGGPVVLKTILEALPASLPVPVLIVQHIATGFTQGLVDWLAQSTGFAVQLASDGLAPLPGHAYVAPEGRQMRIGADGRISLGSDLPRDGHCPSVACLFASAAKVWGAQAIGVLLTGMGRDGAAELKELRDAGAVTLVQDEETSAIHGMPGEAIRMGAATHVMAPQQIGAMLAAIAA
ncbi:MAG TPA: chemotaxis-specific protein-glutamate methyltransferase CheB [Ramlibacter sp.]|uniref:chemotaxis-specific protein-glutamate methyltransferase CheB n=1 Tax=Ramlibacter sp. TaxID=1917967 RepID=UPI002D1AEE48|nr:chemotaxis-specific protein-glutamate methyltransferase CheB [Ramlibacter sp.]HVZ43470.1 chemotaxis-specific protein-glutamate methyltransferase CheB [Ramlibacter sp.]